jgi:hypothetical protein
MGTRGLTVVILGNEPRVAQYGQWDHYPEGQGMTVLNFIKGNDMSLFKEKVNKTRFVSNDEVDSFLKTIGDGSGWLTTDQSELFNKKFPYLSRNHGADILSMILESEDDEIVLRNSFSFGGDSLFCEWAYVIDLDNEVYEVYRGFNKEDLVESERFYSVDPKDEDGEFKQVKFVKSFKFDNLPSTKEDFLIELGEKDDE